MNSAVADIGKRQEHIPRKLPLYSGTPCLNIGRRAHRRGAWQIGVKVALVVIEIENNAGVGNGRSKWSLLRQCECLGVPTSIARNTAARGGTQKRAVQQ